MEESYGGYKMSLLLQAITEKAIKTSIVFHWYLFAYINETHYSLYKPLMCSEMFYGQKVPPYLILAPRERIFPAEWQQAAFSILGGSFISKWVTPGPGEGWQETSNQGCLPVGLLGQTGTPPLTHTLNIPSREVGELALVVTSQKGIMSASLDYTHY